MRKRHTNMSNEELYHLLKKYREGRCTAEEVERVERWYHQFDEEAEHVPEIPREKLEQLWIAIAARLKEGRRKRLRWWRWGAVASVAALLVAGWLLWRGEERTAETPVAVADAGGMLPAKGVVTLKLNDGRVVALTGDTVFREQNNMAIANDSVRGLDYSDAAVGDTVAVVWNTVETPVGSEYRVVLSDGTRVVLNSCSSLSYPVPFTGDNREVKLAGEAFFEVERDGRPFVVSTGRLDVRVMGTSFDVSDYAEAKGHTYSETVHPVTCVSYGYTEHKCADCGDRYVTDYQKAAGHTYLDIVVEATKDSIGYTRHLCVVCNYSYLSDFVTSGDSGYIEDEEPAHEHEYKLYVQNFETEKYFIALRVCVCGDSKVGNLNIQLSNAYVETMQVASNEYGEVDYADLYGNWLLTILDEEGT